MSLLPQRKKSAEEIAKLRESLGIPGVSAVEDAPPATTPPVPAETVETIVPAHHEATHTPDSTTPAPLPGPVHQNHNPHGPKPVHSLKRSEQIPVLTEEATTPAPTETVTLATPALAPKIVRSLRKSEQGPVQVCPPAGDSKLPIHRHSDKELNEIRRRDALAAMTATPNPKLAVAHMGWLISGYLLAAGAASPLILKVYETYLPTLGNGEHLAAGTSIPIAVPSACAAAALLIAGFVFLRRPISRHHAAFIAVISLFVIVFGALHYFPQLRHAT